MLWIPLSVFSALVAASLISPSRFLSVATSLNDAVLDIFSSAFAFAAFTFVLTCLWAAVSPLGKVRIGGEGAKPLLSRWNWMAITLTTTIAIGIIFWGTAEPLYHLYDPGGTNAAAGSKEAARFSLSSLFMHWAFTPYAIYTVPGLTFALVYYNLKKPFSLASPLSVLFGRALPRWAADLLDGLALLALLFGLSASLGAGILSISGGIVRLTPLTMGSALLGIVALAIIAAFFISSASGLQRGIRVLSDINTKLFLALIAFVLIIGPTVSILSLAAVSFGDYVTEFIPRSLLLSPHNNQDWLQSWTVFYFANWMAWAPLTALFLARVSRGYTVREYILFNLFIPAMFSIVWMSIFGGITLTLEQDAPGALNNILYQSGPESVLYAVLDYLPFAALLAALVVFMSFLSYVTAADSNINVIATLCQREGYFEPFSRVTLGLKLLWAVAVGAAAWIMTSLAGIDGIKMLSNLGGLPALFIICAFNVVLVMLGTVKLKALRSSSAAKKT